MRNRRFRVNFGIKPLIPKVNPSPPEPTMRAERIIQASIFDMFAGHEIGRELKAMSQWLDGHPTLVRLVADDLRRRGVTETGRRGLPAESVLRCGLLKQHRQLSYEELAFHFEDSSSFRAFARLRCHGRQRSRCCTRRSAPSARRPGKRSTEPCWPARARKGWSLAGWCGWTARSPPP